LALGKAGRLAAEGVKPLPLLYFVVIVNLHHPPSFYQTCVMPCIFIL